jgi:site-specific DNA recombinase
MSAKIHVQLRAVLYTRFSTDKQASTEDQFRVCERIAEREGFTITHRFADEAISGGTANRPGYQDLLAAARRHDFDVIVAEDSSRLWRNMAEQSPRLAELRDLGLHIVTHNFDTRQEEASDWLGPILGTAAQVYRKEIARRTRRGLEGNALAHRPTGGKAYGYRSTVLPDGTKALVIVEAEAEVVRRIFREYVHGHSPRDIAAGLNADSIPSPGAAWKRNGFGQGKRADGKWQSTAIHGHIKRGTGILNNPRYVGRIEWGRSQWKRSATDSDRRTPILNPEPLHSYTDETQRIVAQELWDAVKARQSRIHLSSATVRSAVARTAGRPARHLLSGLFACGTCGGSYVRINARDYGCSTRKNGGPSACPNSATILCNRLERDVLDVIRSELLTVEAVEFVVCEVRRGLREARRNAPRAPVTDQTLATKDREIDDLRGLMRSGVLSPTVAQAALNRATQDRVDLVAALKQKDTRSTDRVLRLIPDIARRFHRMMAQLPNTDLPQDELTQARAAIHAFLGGRATVERDSSGRVLARLTLDGRPLLGAAAASLDNVVAGVGFEPTTFGL